MDPYHLRRRDLPTTRSDPVQGVHTFERSKQSADGEEPLGHISPSLIALGISSSAAGPEEDTFGEKTLGSTSNAVTFGYLRNTVSASIDADIAADRDPADTFCQTTP